MFKLILNADELWVGEKRGLMVEGVPLLVIRTQAEIAVFTNRCPHAGALLSEGTLVGDTLTCQRHGWQFDVRTGAGINPQCTALKKYEIFIDRDQDIWVELDLKSSLHHAVGPVLMANSQAEVVLQAIKRLNKDVYLQRQGTYWRILVPFECLLTKKTVEKISGAPFYLPDDLELIMPSFKGFFIVNQDEARWSVKKGSNHER